MAECMLTKDRPFQVVKQLGGGGYGTVHLVHHNSLGTVAYKTCPGDSTGRQAELKEEAELHRKLRHPNIIILYETVFNSTCCGLFIEYMKYGSVEEFIRKFKVPPELRIQIIYETASGMSYLHENQPIIIHGDLSSQNILIGDGFHAKIADFGLSRTLKENYENSKTVTPLRGKFMYIAPEYFKEQCKRKSEKFDVYGFAISAWEILSQKRAYHACTEKRLISIFVERGERPDMSEIDKTIPSTIKQLIVDCWHGNHEERPCFKFIKNHLFDYVSKIESELRHSYTSLTDQEKLMPLPNDENKCEISNTGTITSEAQTQKENRSTDTISLVSDIRGRNSCEQCWRIFGDDFDRKPMKICNDGCVRCNECSIKLQKSNSPCPAHNSPILKNLIELSVVLDMVKAELGHLCDVDFIDPAKLNITYDEPYAKDCFADVFIASWKSKAGHLIVKAPKAIDKLYCSDEEMKRFKLEANLAIGINDDNIVRMLGLTILNDKRLGIVMRKADNGSLKDCLTELNNSLAVKISNGILDGLEYLHKKRIAHLGLKPSNVLLFGSDKIPTITDFGNPKIIEKLFLRSKDRKYSAPELITSTYRGDAVDIYSFTVMLFEMFSRQMAETLLGATDDEVMESILMGKRKAIPEDFPKCLSKIVDQGWMPLRNDVKRPTLNEIGEALAKVEKNTPTMISRRSSLIASTKYVSTELQCSETNEEHIPLPIVSSVKWDESVDSSASRKLREKMVEEIKSSNLGRIINVTVLDVMKIVPRHLFLEKSRCKSTETKMNLPRLLVFLKNVETPTELEIAYNSKKPMPTSPTGSVNESSPEVIGSLLSLTDIEMGHHVLLVGIKGGYIQSVVAQLVGHFGSVLTVSSNSEMIEICRRRIDDHCPVVFRDRIRWLYVPHAEISDNVADALKRRKLSFHAIIYCGRVARFPESMKSVLHPVGQSSIVAPVDEEGDGDASQRMKIFKKNGNNPGEMRSITDFSFIFGAII